MEHFARCAAPEGGVHFDLEPGDEHGAEVGFPAGSRLILEVEKITDAFGGGFHHDKRAGYVGHGGVERLHEVVGVFGEGGTPKPHFRQVQHGEVERTERVRVFRRSCPHDAAALGDVFNAVHAFVSGETQSLHFGRISGEHAGDYAPDIGRLLLVLGDDGRMPVVIMEQLQPQHINLGSGRSSPLAGFYQDHAHRQPGGAHFFEFRHQPPLSPVEAERNGAFRELILYFHTGICPKFEVVTEAVADETFKKLFFLPGSALSGVFPEERLRRGVAQFPVDRLLRHGDGQV